MDRETYETLWQGSAEDIESLKSGLNNRQEAVRFFDELFRYVPDFMRPRLKELRRNTLQRMRMNGGEAA